MSPALPTALTPLPRRKLPIGLQTLREIREQGHYYVDKTGLAIDLIESGKAYFLSRPRRFGKSLLVDTFKELFEGNRTLFEGVAAEQRWDWDKRYPVIRFSFGGGRMHDRVELEQRMSEMLDEHRVRLGLAPFEGVQTLTGRFTLLLRKAQERHGAPVVVLVDEYDKPILDHLGDRETAAAMRDALLQEYGVPPDTSAETQEQLTELLQRGALMALEGLFRALFASIPHDWYRSNPLAGFEGHYASVFYCHFAALGLDIRVEDATSHGRIDMTVLHAGQVFVFEFKVVEGAATGEALRQIRAKGYADKYRGRGEPIHLIGVEFGKAVRNIVGFEVVAEVP